MLIKAMHCSTAYGENMFSGVPFPTLSKRVGTACVSVLAGVAATVMLATFSRPAEEPMQHKEALSTLVADESALAQKLATDVLLQKGMAEHVQRRYRIAHAAAKETVEAAIRVSHEQKVDPFLVLAIIERESSFNKQAISSYRAVGLMQIHIPSHRTLLHELGIDTRQSGAAEKALMSKASLNVAAGTRIYKQYERQLGSVEMALQAYNGARRDQTFKYARKVLASRDAYYTQASVMAQLHDAAPLRQTAFPQWVAYQPPALRSADLTMLAGLSAPYGGH